MDWKVENVKPNVKKIFNHNEDRGLDDLSFKADVIKDTDPV